MTKKRVLTTVSTIISATWSVLQKRDSVNLKIQSYQIKLLDSTFKGYLRMTSIFAKL